MSSSLLASQKSLHAKRHRKVLDQLIACGIEDLISVPKIAIIGSQSAGKSSILEALSGITFPRAAGTCTRCPSEVRLFSSDCDWVCNISLRFDKGIHSGKQDNVRVVPFGKPIMDPSKVQSRLIQAQRAILNPNKSLDLFLNDSTCEVKDEVQFSESIICIDVKGRDVRDLSVVDLPGIIFNVGEGEDDRNPKLIRSLAKKEISRDNCVVLLCITMKDDYQNQIAVQMAKEADPKGQRTLGVLTKPDRIEDGTFDYWKPILEGNDLLHGHYVVKNPDPSQLGQMTHEEARADEEAFFQTKPWSTLGSKIRSRLGSQNLAAKLSTLLNQIVKKRMPALVKEVKELHRQVTDDLKDLPKELPESQLVFHMGSLVKQFEQELQYSVIEAQEDGSLADDIYNMTLSFWRDMIEYRPRFLPATDSELISLEEYRNPPHTLIGLENLIETRDFLFEEDKAELAARGIMGSETTVTVDEERKLAETLTSKESIINGFGSSIENLKQFDMVLLTLTEVNKIKSKSTRDLLPNNTPWRVKEQLIRTCTKNWESITFHTLENITARLLQECSVLVRKHFSRFQIGGLESVVNRVMEELITKKCRITEDFILCLIKLETRYTTISGQDFTRRQEQLKQCLVKAREECQIKALVKTATGREDEYYAALTETTAHELNLVSEIRAYWQIAFKRYTDNVRSAFYTILLQPILDDTFETLASELGIYEENAMRNAKMYLQEDMNIIQRRNDLLAKEQTLSSASQVINAFWTDSLRVDA